MPRRQVYRLVRQKASTLVSGVDGVAPEHIRGATVEARSDEHCQENHVRQHLHAAQGRPTDVMAPETPRNSGANRLRAGGAAPGASCQRADPSSMAAQPAFRCSLPSPLPAGRDPHRPPRQRPFPPFLARQPPASAALADAVRSACRPGSKSMHSGPGQLAARAARFRTRAQWSSAVARLHSAVTLLKKGRSSKRVVRPPASMGVSGCDAPSRPRAARSVRFNLEMSIQLLVQLLAAHQLPGGSGRGLSAQARAHRPRRHLRTHCPPTARGIGDGLMQTFASPPIITRAMTWAL